MLEGRFAQYGFHMKPENTQHQCNHWLTLISGSVNIDAQPEKPEDTMGHEFHLKSSRHALPLDFRIHRLEMLK